MRMCLNPYEVRGKPSFLAIFDMHVISSSITQWKELSWQYVSKDKVFHEDKARKAFFANVIFVSLVMTLSRCHIYLNTSVIFVSFVKGSNDIVVLSPLLE